MLTKTHPLPSPDNEPIMNAEAFKQAVTRHLTYSIGKPPRTATPRDWFHAIALAVRDRMTSRWMQTLDTYHEADTKRVYYLSMEFLVGRLLINSVSNLGDCDAYRQALSELGLNPEDVRGTEFDAALGNGGLGRLAACFLDSMATLNIPGYGYGIRYEYGMFHQQIENGCQVEHPDNWLRYGNPWEFARPEVLYPVKFHGRVIEYRDERGHLRHQWVDTDDVMAMAYDIPVPGYRTPTVNSLRLWAAKASRDFELQYFNQGNYIKAVEEKNASENLSKVLYPADTTVMGQELRLKQQYFFVCAAMQDILHRFAANHHPLERLADKVAIQLNDTHPAIAIPELMRILVDQHRMSWEQAWDITVETFSYTNHTLLPEALETWSVEMMERVLPRHLQIIYEINSRFLRDVNHRHPGDTDLLRNMSLIDENGGKRVRMANLAIVGSHKVNGVSQIHTDLLRRSTFANMDRFYPDRFINMTNGITPRLWLKQANPRLSELISSRIGEDWGTDLRQLEKIAALAEDGSFRSAFQEVKHANKVRLAGLIKKHLKIEADPASLFDVQIKRIHEYKRQLLNVLHIITRYNQIRRGLETDPTPRTVIFAGKAAPGYRLAKLIIKLINDVADVVNNDPVVHDRLKVAFIPNYDVSTALDIIPAANLSEQISTAGTEASGTGNMKLALNGALTIGTLDGANIEIGEEVGQDNIFIFGHTAEEVARLRREGYDPLAVYHENETLREVLDMIGSGFFSPDCSDRFHPLLEALTSGGDHYLLLADYAAYVNCQKAVDAVYRQPEEWARRAILNVAHMGKFSSDRTIREYAEQIWRVNALR